MRVLLDSSRSASSHRAGTTGARRTGGDRAAGGCPGPGRQVSGSANHELHPGAGVVEQPATLGADRRAAMAREGRRRISQPFTSEQDADDGGAVRRLTSLAGALAFADAWRWRTMPRHKRSPRELRSFMMPQTARRADSVRDRLDRRHVHGQFGFVARRGRRQEAVLGSCSSPTRQSCSVRMASSFTPPTAHMRGDAGTDSHCSA